jgi:hypothetical protein
VRRGAVVVALMLLAGGLAGPDGPRIALSLSASDTGPPAAVVQLTDLLEDDRFLSAMRAGFPLYVAVTVQLRESRALWDREVDRWVTEWVVVFDPVRDLYRLEDDAGTEEISDRTVLERRLARAYVVPLSPDGSGRYHYQASITARTLSDKDVDDVYAWLRGDEADSTRPRPGLLARAARKLLVQVAPLPRVTLDARTDDFDAR